MEAEEGGEGHEGRIGQYSPEESVVRKVAQR